MFVMKDAEGIVAIPILERKIDKKQLDATSVYGYPGPISNIKDPSTFQKMYKELLRDIYLKSYYVSIFSRTNCFTLSDESLSRICLNSGHTVTIDLNCSEEEQISKYRKKLKYDIRKVIHNGVSCDFVIPDASNINIFIDLYNSKMRSVKASEYYFFDKSYYHDLFRNNLADIKMVHCRFQGEIICVGIFFFCNGIAQYHLGANSEKYKIFSATKLMIDFIRNYAYCNNYKFFHLGGGFGDDDDDDSLLHFKKGFSNRINKVYYIKEILNKEGYNHLSKDRNFSDYFPLYRS